MHRRLSILILATLALVALAASPAGAATSVTKAQREVVIFSPGLAQGTALESAFYNFVEFNAIALATATLGTRYNTVHIVRGAAATRAAWRTRSTTIASKSTIRAVDLVFITHGATDEVLLSDDRWTTQRGSRPDPAPASRWPTAPSCGWSSRRPASARRTAPPGARPASRPSPARKKIYADSAASYLPFLSTWAVGGSFGASILAANVAGAPSGWDQAASAWYLSRGKPVEASQIDSFRLTSGFTALTIGTMS